MDWIGLDWIHDLLHHNTSPLATRAGLTFPVSRVARHLKQVNRTSTASDKKHVASALFRTVTSFQGGVVTGADSSGAYKTLLA